MEEYFTILNDETAEITEKKSKFIANIYYIETIQDAEEKIKNIKKKYYDAKHHCIAYRVIENGIIIEKSSDDGEPSGTAGAPMLNILQKNNLCNVIIIVTRYFGGILLGPGGLVRAYSEATQMVIEKIVLVKKILGEEAKIKLDYSNLDIFKYYCKNNDIKITNIEYLDDIILTIEMEKNRKISFEKNLDTKSVKIKQLQWIKTKYISKTVEKNK